MRSNQQIFELDQQLSMEFFGFESLLFVTLELLMTFNRLFGYVRTGIYEVAAF